MAENPFDKSARSLVSADPPAFFAWATGMPGDVFAFGGWLDTRALPLPHEPDQTGDRVARLTNTSAVEPDWAVAVEFQIEPDAQMFGRLMVFLGHLWQEVKPAGNRGDRFQLAAIVVNLTGRGIASRDMRWPAAGFGTELRAVERNLAHEKADDVLAGVESGRWSRAMLPWLPLMIGGDKADVIDRWKRLIEGEPDWRLRGRYGMIAKVFAGAAKRKEIWEKALEGWDMIESEVVNEWIAKGEARGRAEGKAEGAATALVAVLEARFGSVPAEVETAVRGCADLAKLRTWTAQAATAATLTDFRTAIGL